MGTENSKPRGRPFAPGKSGNPGGRPKGWTEVAAAAREHTLEAINTLVAALKCPNKGVAVRAAAEILDRGWGKPVASIDMRFPDGAIPVEAKVQALKALSDDQLDQLEALVGKAEEAREPPADAGGDPG